MTPALIAALIALAGYFGIWGYRKVAKANHLPDDDLVEAALKVVIESLVRDGLTASGLQDKQVSLIGATRLQSELQQSGISLTLDEAQARVSAALGRR